MTKPRLLVGTIGSTTKITDCTSLQAAEMEAMCRIGERYGYEALVAEASPSSKTRAAKFPTGRKVWDGKGSVDTVWLHQQGPNYMGGPSEKVCEAIDFLASGLHSAKRCIRLVVDNNESMRHGSVYGIERRTECESFKLAGAEIRRKVDRGDWLEAGIPECVDPKMDFPFTYVDITSEQLKLSKEIFGLNEEKTVDFCCVGSSRASEKKRQARLARLGDFVDHENSHYSGSLFKKRCGFVKGWELMSEARAHLIVREPTMTQKPLHRYLQALIHDAIPVVLGEPEPVSFIHNDELSTILRVTSLAQGLDLVARREELLPLLRAERDYWFEFDRGRATSL